MASFWDCCGAFVIVLGFLTLNSGTIARFTYNISVQVGRQVGFKRGEGKTEISDVQKETLGKHSLLVVGSWLLFFCYLVCF